MHLLVHFLYKKNQYHFCLTAVEKIKFLSDFRFLHYPHLKSYSSTSKSTTQTSIVKNYLVNSCGLSPKAALIAAKKVHFSSTEKPNSVLKFFQSYGFSKTQITKIISRHPSFLLYNPENTLKPKIDCFHNLGFSAPQLTKILSSDPTMLIRGLKTLLTSVQYLKTFGSNHDIQKAFKRATWILGCNLEKVIGLHITILCTTAIPKSNISKLLFGNPRVLLLIQSDRFKEIINVIKEMGFDCESMMFIHALRISIGMTKKNWERKLNVYKELGWSEEEALLMFKKQPISMSLSEEKTKAAVDFFMSKLNWNVEQICSNAALLSLSLENRIIPRCSVLGVLNSKGELSRLIVTLALQMSEELFLEKYVALYQERIPDVLKAYEGKIGFAGFGKGGLELVKRVVGNGIALH